MTLNESSALIPNGKKPGIRVRPFMDSDSTELFDLYKYTMFNGRASPINQFLNDQLKKPFSFVLYSLFTLGLGLAFYPGTLSDVLGASGARDIVRGAGLIISAGSGWLFYGWRRSIFVRYKTHFDTGSKDDLMNPGRHYWGIDDSVLERLDPTDPTQSNSPNGFWVAEVTDGKNKGKIVGCIGLDTSTNADPTTAELRRMVVSPDYQRCGIGGKLVECLLDHAKAFHQSHPGKLDSIWLSTSMYQRQAMKLYERYGFVEGPKKVIALKYLFITDRPSLHFFKYKL